MKNRIWLIPLALMLALSLVAVGCPAPVVDPVVPVVPEPVAITWIAQFTDPAGTVLFKALDRMVDRIEVATGGRLVIALHPGGGIVPADKEMIPTHKGILDMAITAPVGWVADLPHAVPFGMKVGGPTALEYHFWYLWGEGLDLMQEMFDDAGLNI